MTTGVVVLNFGEPPVPERDVVIEYLEGIFLANADLDGATGEDARDRARQLAERRAPGLLEEYAEIGGSPLNDQAISQANEIEAELSDRGYEIQTYVGMQFTEPFISDVAESLLDDDVEEVVALPIYPLCGPSTTIQALSDLRDAMDDRDLSIPVHEITGWHKHPAYNRLRAENVKRFVANEDVSLTDPDTTLLFSAHGTPQYYLNAGSRYDRYVNEYCQAQASLLGGIDYELGYQNHENRDIPWTDPDVETVIESLATDRVVVEPVSFMHEQSETLSELDIELNEEAADAGIDLHRVPIPHDDPRFPSLLADLTEPFLAGMDPEYYQLQPCLCRETPDTYCLNAGPNRLSYEDQPSEAQPSR